MYFIYIYNQKTSTCNRDVQLSLVQVTNEHFEHQVRQTGASPVSQNWLKPTESPVFPFGSPFPKHIIILVRFYFCTKERVSALLSTVTAGTTSHIRDFQTFLMGYSSRKEPSPSSLSSPHCGSWTRAENMGKKTHLGFGLDDL